MRLISALAAKSEEADASENEEWMECLESDLGRISALCADLKKGSPAKKVEEFGLGRQTMFFSNVYMGNFFFVA